MDGIALRSACPWCETEYDAEDIVVADTVREWEIHGGLLKATLVVTAVCPNAECAEPCSTVAELTGSLTFEK
jgi:hypothetical protein